MPLPDLVGIQLCHYSQIVISHTLARQIALLPNLNAEAYPVGKRLFRFGSS